MREDCQFPTDVLKLHHSLNIPKWFIPAAMLWVKKLKHPKHTRTI